MVALAYRHKLELCLLILFTVIAVASASSPTTIWVQVRGGRVSRVVSRVVSWVALRDGRIARWSRCESCALPELRVARAARREGRVGCERPRQETATEQEGAREGRRIRWARPPYTLKRYARRDTSKSCVWTTTHNNPPFNVSTSPLVLLETNPTRQWTTVCILIFFCFLFDVSFTDDTR